MMMRWAFSLFLLLASLSTGRPLQAQEAAEEASEEAEVKVPTLEDGKTDVDQALAVAQTNFDNLEYDVVLPYVEAVLKESDLTPDQKLQAYLLKGQSLAIVGDPVDAERPFRLLLRVQPDFSLPENTPPKITGVFSRVQTEENAIRDQVYRLARARKIEKVKIKGKAPKQGKGGKALEFSFSLQDPDESVTAMNVGYRRLGEGEYSSLALNKNNRGVYRSAITAQWTENERDYQIEYYVTTQDREGPLRQMHTPDQPGLIQMEKGFVPYQISPKVVYITAGTAGAFALFGLIAETNVYTLSATRDRMYAEAAEGAVLDGKILTPVLEQGAGWRTAGYIGWGAAALTAGAAAAMVPFMKETVDGLKLEE